MTPKELKILFIEKNITQAELAREAGTSQAMIHHIVQGRSRSRRIENIIAKRVQRPAVSIFPISPEPIWGRKEQAA